MSDPLPAGAGRTATVYGADGRVWPTAVVLSLIVALWPLIGELSDDPAFLRSTWVMALAALFIGWLQWKAARSRVVVDGGRVWAGHAGRLVGPLDFSDVIAAHVGGGRGNVSFYLANGVGVGAPAPRTLRWGLPADDPVIGRLGTAHVMVVPRLARTKANRALYAALGRELIDAGATLSPIAAASIRREIDRAAR